MIPPGLTVFTDRDLGSRIVPERLREVGLTMVTIAEHYGQTRARGPGRASYGVVSVSQAPATMGVDTVVVQVPSTDPARIAAVLQAIGPYVGSARISIGPSVDSLGESGTAITALFPGLGSVEDAAVVAAALAGDLVPGAWAAWVGTDAMVRTTTSGPRSPSA